MSRRPGSRAVATDRPVGERAGFEVVDGDRRLLLADHHPDRDIRRDEPSARVRKLR
jgi:hypothetical protein